MKTFKNIFMLSAILAISNAANAGAACDKVISAFLNAEKGELSLYIKDYKAVPNACDYVTRRVEYVESIKTLLIDVQEQPCFVDRQGKRSARVKWNLPTELRADATIQLILNQKKSGSVTVKGGQVGFEAETECVKH